MGRWFLLAIFFVPTGAGATVAQDPEPAKPRSIGELLKAIKSDDEEKRDAAFLELTGLTSIPESATADFIKIMRTPNEAEQMYATLILAKIGKPAVARVAALLDDADEVVRFHAIWALALMGEPARPHAAAILKAMRDPDDDVRCKAAFAMKRLGIPARQARSEEHTSELP